MGDSRRSCGKVRRHGGGTDRPTETNYTEIFWRIQKAWAHDPRFSAENFAFQPLYLISQAYEYAKKLDREHYHSLELPVARLTYHYIDAHRDHKKSTKPDFKDFLFFMPQEEQKQIPALVANTVYSTVRDNSLPPWLFFSLPRREIFANRRGVQIVYPRLWIDCEGESIALFCPLRQADNKLFVEVAMLTDGVTGPRLVKDIDTKEVFMVEIPQREEPDVCIYELQLKMI